MKIGANPVADVEQVRSAREAVGGICDVIFGPIQRLCSTHTRSGREPTGVTVKSGSTQAADAQVSCRQEPWATDGACPIISSIICDSEVACDGNYSGLSARQFHRPARVRIRSHLAFERHCAASHHNVDRPATAHRSVHAHGTMPIDCAEHRQADAIVRGGVWKQSNQIYDAANTVEVADDERRIVPEPGTEHLAANGHDAGAIDGERHVIEDPEERQVQQLTMDSVFEDTFTEGRDGRHINRRVLAQGWKKTDCGRRALRCRGE